MSEHIPYIVVINGEKDTGRKTVCLELALVLLYNRQKTAVLLNEDSSLRQTFNNRRQNFQLCLSRTYWNETVSPSPLRRMMP